MLRRNEHDDKIGTDLRPLLRSFPGGRRGARTGNDRLDDIHAGQRAGGLRRRESHGSPGADPGHVPHRRHQPDAADGRPLPPVRAHAVQGEQGLPEPDGAPGRNEGPRRCELERRHQPGKRLVLSSPSRPTGRRRASSSGPTPCDSRSWMPGSCRRRKTSWSARSLPASATPETCTARPSSRPCSGSSRGGRTSPGPRRSCDPRRCRCFATCATPGTCRTTRRSSSAET